MEMNTKEDILRWADEVVAAKGAMFTPLSKADQYEIALYIQQTNNDKAEEGELESEENSGWENEPPMESPLEGDITSAGEATMSSENKAEDADDATAEVESRYEWLVEGSQSSQQAFDKYLEYCRNKGVNSLVMDYSNGRQEYSVGFTMWLLQRVSKNEFTLNGKQAEEE